MNKFIPYLIKVYSNIDGKSKNFKIESSLTSSKYLSSLNELGQLKCVNFRIDNKSNCLICSKGFYSSEVVFVYPGKIYHPECFNYLQDK